MTRLGRQWRSLSDCDVSCAGCQRRLDLREPPLALHASGETCRFAHAVGHALRRERGDASRHLVVVGARIVDHARTTQPVGAPVEREGAPGLVQIVEPA